MWGTLCMHLWENRNIFLLYIYYVISILHVVQSIFVRHCRRVVDESCRFGLECHDWNLQTLPQSVYECLDFDSKSMSQWTTDTLFPNLITLVIYTCSHVGYSKKNMQLSKIWNVTVSCKFHLNKSYFGETKINAKIPYHCWSSLASGLLDKIVNKCLFW